MHPQEERVRSMVGEVPSVWEDHRAMSVLPEGHEAEPLVIRRGGCLVEE
jgi:hypothetical protein